MADVKKAGTAPVDPYEDKVTVRITPPTEEDEGKGMFVSVNEYNAYIKYDEDVEVPRFVKAVLENRRLAIKEKRKNAAKAETKD